MHLSIHTFCMVLKYMPTYLDNLMKLNNKLLRIFQCKQLLLLLRIVFCNSETTSFKSIGIQYLSSSFVFHLLQTFFFCFFWMNLIISFPSPALDLQLTGDHLYG